MQKMFTFPQAFRFRHCNNEVPLKLPSHSIIPSIYSGRVNVTESRARIDIINGSSVFHVTDIGNVVEKRAYLVQSLAVHALYMGLCALGLWDGTKGIFER